MLVGDVWVCGGQSNMQWTIENAFGAGPATATAGDPLLRLYTVNRAVQPKPTPMPEEWLVDSPQSVPSFSAVGYYFGLDLQKSLGIPIGLISSNIGGTAAERWTPKEALAANDELSHLAMRQSSDLYNGMIAPLTRFPIKGAIWYQGEANAPRAWQYRTLLPVMIKAWRDAWKEGDFPFIVVQLAPYANNQPQSKNPVESDWAELREAQSLTSQTVPNVGLAVITDLGDPGDIHPKRKREVGERLAAIAKAQTYGQKIPFSGPVFDKQTIAGDKIILNFKHVGSGLVAAGGDLTGFAIAGEDQKYVTATARIEGNTVVVSSDQVPHPVAVRYGWSNFPVLNLWNKDGLPACPFRSDDFPAITKDKK